MGEEFNEAKTKEDSIKLKSLLADGVIMRGASPEERWSGKEPAGNLFARGMTMVSDAKFTQLTKKGDANLVYYTGFYSQKLAPSTYQKGGILTSSYLMMANKDSKNNWKISYMHMAAAPLQKTSSAR